MMKILYILCVVALFSNSCTKSQISERELEVGYINNGIEKIGIDKEKKWVVILPGLGCTGCIQEGESFMKEFADNKTILFVLTNVESLKILQLKTGIDVSKFSNVYVDKKGLFNLHTHNVNYPCIVELSNGQAGEHQFQSPENSQAFAKLKMKLTS